MKEYDRLFGTDSGDVLVLGALVCVSLSLITAWLMALELSMLSTCNKIDRQGSTH